MSENVYGIDLGTTYSCVSRINSHGLPEIIEDQFDNTATTPSVVYFYESDDPDEVKTIVGADAKEEAKIDPERAISAFKIHMDKDDWFFTLDGKDYSPVDLSAFVLQHIVSRASERIEEPIKNVVITVPAYFGTKERQRTEEAGRKAGLNVMETIPEPMAAALAYNIDHEDEDTSTVLVFDLGGGTFDVTIMEFSGRSKQSLAHRGDNELGGVLWDEELALHWAKEISDETGEGTESVWDTPETRENLMQSAERAKQRLSAGRENLQEFIEHDGARYKCEIDASTFDSITEGRLAQTMDLVDDAIRRSEEKRPGLKIDKVLLVGGSTLMPQVKKRLQAHMGDDTIIKLHNPHLSVALGAAIYAEKKQIDDWLEDYIKLKLTTEDGEAPSDEEINQYLSEPESPEAKDAIAKAAEQFGRDEEEIYGIAQTNIIDVAPKSIGMRHNIHGMEGFFVTNFVQTQQELPASYTTDDFGTVQDDQRKVQLVCVENEREQGPDGEPFEFDPDQAIGEIVLPLEPGLPKGTKIEITIDFSETGRIRMYSRDPIHGTEVEGEFSHGSSATAVGR